MFPHAPDGMPTWPHSPVERFPARREKFFSAVHTAVWTAEG